MFRGYFIVSIFCLFVALCADTASRAQAKKTKDFGNVILFQKFIQDLQIENCIQDLPPPTLLAEPRYTKGLSNIIKFHLPALSNIPFSVDSMKYPFVITMVQEGSDTSPLIFPKPVNLLNDSPVSEIIKSLKNSKRYTYTTALFIPLCKIDCDEVTNINQLELHCSAYEDTIWSIQDIEAPLIENVRIPQLDSTQISGWWNKPAVQIEANFSDPAGVWQGYLYWRNCSGTEWGSAIEDTAFAGDLTETGFVFSGFVRVSFFQNLAEGCNEFRIEGKDATHTPESSFPNFQLAGNEGQPLSGTPAHVKINIDTKPPTSVNLICVQKLNAIHLNWTTSFDVVPGIGLAGYYVFRNAVLLDSLSASDTTYIDTILEENQDSDFVYQIQPFDSLGNVQKAGGSANCIFLAVPEIVMLPEPAYTAGDSNLVCWTGSSLISSYSVFIAEDCDYNDARMFEVTDTCFTFKDLLDGTKYCYWVRAVDQLQRIVFSDTVESTQDATLPDVVYLEFINSKILQNQIWSNTRNIKLRIVATDYAPGVIRYLQIIENGISDTSFNLREFRAHIDTIISVLLISDECQPIEISVKIEDRAGNESELKSQTIYLDETPPGAIADLNCEQMQSVNGIKLSWTSLGEPENCSGLAGYRINRNEKLIAIVAPNFVTYVDLLPEETPTQQFIYKIQPFDSLDNLQNTGGLGICDYIGKAQITINSMEKFIQGLSNEVCWTYHGSLVSLSVFIDDNCDSVPDDSVLYLNPSQSEMCHLFQNLNDGQQYCYWVSGMDEQRRIVLSDTVTSIQDSSNPVINSFTLPGAELLDGQIWVYDRDIQLNLIAHDALPGEIWNYDIFENGLSRMQANFKDSSAQMNELISFNLNTAGNQTVKIELSARVFDGANNVSSLSKISVNLQENLTGMIGFPNPFNPKKGKMTIRLDKTNENEIKIYDFFGNLVRILNAKENLHDFIWDGRNGEGEMVANGGYICIGSETNMRFKIGVKKQTN